MRWILSHVLRHRLFVGWLILATVIASALSAFVPTRIGAAFNGVLDGTATRESLILIAAGLLGIVLLRGLVDCSARFASEFLGKRLARDARDELSLSLLGKSQTFHNRQRVGDVMARSTNDVTLLSDMMVPGVDLIVDSGISLVMPLIFIALIDP